MSWVPFGLGKAVLCLRYGSDMTMSRAGWLSEQLPDMDVVVKTNGSHFEVGAFTTHFRTYFSGWIGMFTARTIWSLTHGHM